MTTEPPVTISRAVSRRAERNFHDRVVQICTNYKAIDKHLIANHNGEFSEVCEAFKLAHENLCAADLYFERLSASRPSELCEQYETALDSLIGTFDFKMRVESIAAVMLTLVAASSGLVAGRYGPGPAIAMAAISLILAAYFGFEAKRKLNSTFRYAYSLQSQMKRDLGLAIKVIEDDKNPHH